MPDHIHLILTPGGSTALEMAVQLIKGGSSREIGKRPNMHFPVWHAGFTEHQIRDQWISICTPNTWMTIL
jgi:REP element-mobilizing transposase RayT